MSCLSFLCELHCLRCKEHIFDKVFKVIRDCLGFDLLRSVIGPENLHCFLNQSDEKQEPITSFRQLVCFKCKFLLSFSSLLIGCCHYFLGFVFTILILKPTLKIMCTDRKLSIKFSGYHRLTHCLSVSRYNSRHVD